MASVTYGTGRVACPWLVLLRLHEMRPLRPIAEMSRHFPYHYWWLRCNMTFGSACTLANRSDRIVTKGTGGDDEFSYSSRRRPRSYPALRTDAGAPAKSTASRVGRFVCRSTIAFALHQQRKISRRPSDRRDAATAGARTRVDSRTATTRCASS
jgi:hypothetical protein